MYNSKHKQNTAKKFNRDRDSRKSGKVSLSKSNIAVLISMGLLKQSDKKDESDD